MNQCAQRPFTCIANISVKSNHWYCMLLYFGGLNTEKTLRTDLYSVFLLIAESIHTLEHVCKCYDIVTVFFHPGQNQVQNGGMYNTSNIDVTFQCIGLSWPVLNHVLGVASSTKARTSFNHTTMEFQAVSALHLFNSNNLNNKNQ